MATKKISTRAEDICGRMPNGIWIFEGALLVQRMKHPTVAASLVTPVARKLNRPTPLGGRCSSNTSSIPTASVVAYSPKGMASAKAQPLPWRITTSNTTLGLITRRQLHLLDRNAQLLR